MKVCRDCHVEKDLSEFYKHARMGDGYLNKCKSCVKQRVNNHRDDNIEKVREYDRQRAKFPKRAEAKKAYSQTEKYKASQRVRMQRYIEKYPLKRAAHILVSSAILKGKIEKVSVCSVCNSTKKIEAHHDDYSKPLSIRWLCEKCHKAWHKENKAVYV